MQTDHPVHPERAALHIDREVLMEEPPIPVSHLTHTLRNYSQVILVTLDAIMLAYLILAVAMYL